jgi:hypothetical protein
MKSALVIKLFIVLCCYTQPQTEPFRYEVRDASDTTHTGTVYTDTKYSEGDTIKFNITRN